VPRADVALVTNVANDHLGEFGIFDLAGLADAKLVVAKAIGPNGRLVLNADDPLLLERGRSLRQQVVWFTLDAAHPDVTRHIAHGGEACVLDGERLTLIRGGQRRVVAHVSEVPIAFGGTARYNIANALGAIGAAAGVELPLDAVRTGLTRFDSSPAENPGRANRWDLGGVHVIVDYAHNPHGLAAVGEVTAAIPARRRGLVIGQAGDRDDDVIREFARTAWKTSPDRVFIKEMETYLRGRDRGVVPALIEAELKRVGAAPACLERHASEMDAVRAALRWARAGDLLLLTTHAERAAVIALLERLAGRGWTPGDDVA
jgi:UDP-N-acetylmuramyl tripeptide synthase